MSHDFGSFEKSIYDGVIAPYSKVNAFTIVDYNVIEGRGSWSKQLERSGPDDDDYYYIHNFRSIEGRIYYQMFYLDRKTAEAELKRQIKKEIEKLEVDQVNITNKIANLKTKLDVL